MASFPATARRLVLESIAAVVVGVLLGVALHAAGVGASDATPAAEVAAARLERGGDVGTAAVEALERGVLLVEAGGCGDVRQASATLVSQGTRAVVLTNAHVVRGSGTVTVRGPGGEPQVAQVLGAVVGRDAAVLELEGAVDGAEAIDIAPMPAEGEQVTVVGHPDGVASARSGRIAAVERRAGYGGASDVLLVDTEVRGGSSGGAVLDAGGRVVGLVAARDPRTGWAVAYPIGEVLGRALGPVPDC